MIPAFINPAAGRADVAREALERAGGFEIHNIAAPELADGVRTAVAAGAARVVVAGGDGSIGTVAGVLAGTQTELAILPCGTLNHLARDLNLSGDIADAARIARWGTATVVDGATVNGRLFLNTSSVGAYVRFVRVRDRLERHLGYRLASFFAGIRLLATLRLFRVTVSLGAITREYLSPLVFIGVGERELKLPTLGARVRVGRPGLHVMVVRQRSGARTLALALAAVARGTQSVAHTPALDAFLVDECRIDSRSTSVSLDGEIVRVAPTLAYRYLPGCLRIVTDRHGETTRTEP